MVVLGSALGNACVWPAAAFGFQAVRWDEKERLCARERRLLCVCVLAGAYSTRVANDVVMNFEAFFLLYWKIKVYCGGPVLFVHADESIWVCWPSFSSLYVRLRWGTKCCSAVETLHKAWSMGCRYIYIVLGNACLEVSFLFSLSLQFTCTYNAKNTRGPLVEKVRKKKEDDVSVLKKDKNFLWFWCVRLCVLIFRTLVYMY